MRWKILFFVLIILIILILGFFFFVAPSFKFCTQDMAFGENKITGKCKNFGTPCEMPFYYEKSDKCALIFNLEEGYSDAEGIGWMCGRLSDIEKKEIFETYEVCEESTG